jgi:hypothetical protein
MPDRLTICVATMGIWQLTTLSRQRGHSGVFCADCFFAMLAFAVFEILVISV